MDAAAWHYDAATESVVIDAPAAYHEYTVSFLAYLIWDPVHMYNSVINDWKDVEHQIPFDVRQPKTHAYTMRRLREYLESHPLRAVHARVPAVRRGCHCRQCRQRQHPLRLISDIPGVKSTPRDASCPTSSPDTFHEGGDPVREAKENWVTARRAILRKTH